MIQTEFKFTREELRHVLYPPRWNRGYGIPIDEILAAQPMIFKKEYKAFFREPGDMIQLEFIFIRKELVYKKNEKKFVKFGGVSIKEIFEGKKIIYPLKPFSINFLSCN